MTIITFLSDFGTKDHYVAAVKAKILSLDPTVQIIDISHDIERYNLAHGSYVLSQVFRDFPEGTIHLVSINAHENLKDGFLVLQLEGHFFVGANNGLFSLLTEEQPVEIVRIVPDPQKSYSFPTRSLFAEAAVKIASGSKLSDLGEPYDDFKRFMHRQIKATKKQIVGTVVSVDHYGNLITNIERGVFEKLHQGNNYTVNFGRENVPRIQDCYETGEDGDCFVIFNSEGLLEIGINKGNAAELLGLSYDSLVSINFVL